MPYFAITSNSTPSLEKREEEALARSDGEIHQEYLQDDTSTLLGVPKFKGPSQRRNYFSSPANRKQVTYHPSVCVFLPPRFQSKFDLTDVYDDRIQ